MVNYTKKWLRMQNDVPECEITFHHKPYRNLQLKFFYHYLTEEAYSHTDVTWEELLRNFTHGERENVSWFKNSLPAASKQSLSKFFFGSTTPRLWKFVEKMQNYTKIMAKHVKWRPRTWNNMRMHQNFFRAKSAGLWLFTAKRQSSKSNHNFKK